MTEKRKRPYRLDVPLNEEQRKTIEDAAHKDDMEPARWIKFIALREARVGAK